MSARNKFFVLLGIIFVIAATYYFFSTDHSKDLVLIGTVDSNQVIVSAQVEGRIQKLLVDEGTPVKAGDLIAVLDPSELKTQEAAAVANIASLAAQSRGNAAHGDNRLRARPPAMSRMRRRKVRFGESATSASQGRARSNRERQPAHDRTGQGWGAIRTGSRAGGNESAGGAGDRAGTAGVGEGRAGGSHLRDRAHAAGECSAEHGAIDGGRPEECHRSEKSSSGAAGLHQRLCAGDWHSFGAGGDGREKWSTSARRS